MAADTAPPQPEQPKKPQARTPEARPEPEKATNPGKNADVQRPAGGADRSQGGTDQHGQSKGDAGRNLPAFSSLEKQGGPPRADSSTGPLQRPEGTARTAAPPESGTSIQPETPAEPVAPHVSSDHAEQGHAAGPAGHPAEHADHPGEQRGHGEERSHVTAPARGDHPSTHRERPDPRPGRASPEGGAHTTGDKPAARHAEPVRPEAATRPETPQSTVKPYEAPVHASTKGIADAGNDAIQHRREVDNELSAFGLTREMVQDYVKMAYGGATRGDLQGKYGQLEFFRIRDAIEKLPDAVLFEVAPPPKVDSTVYLWPSGRIGTRADETERQVREFNPGTPIGGVARTGAIAAGASPQTVRHVGELGDWVDGVVTAPFGEGEHTGRSTAHGEGRGFTPVHEAPHGPPQAAPRVANEIPHGTPAPHRGPERVAQPDEHHPPRPGDDRFMGGARLGHEPGWMHTRPGNRPDSSHPDSPHPGTHQPGHADHNPRREVDPQVVTGRAPTHDAGHRHSGGGGHASPGRAEAPPHPAPEGHRPTEVPTGRPEQKRENGLPEQRPERHERPPERAEVPDGVPPTPDPEARSMRHYLAEAAKLLTEKPNVEALANGLEEVTKAGHPQEWRAAQAACRAYDRALREQESPARAAQLAGAEYHRRVGAAGPGQGVDFRHPDGSVREVKTHFVPVLDRFVVDKGNQQLLAYLLKDRAERGPARRGTVEHIFIQRPTATSEMRVVRLTVDPLQGRRLADPIRTPR